MLSRHKEANRTFKRALQERDELRKHYKALTLSPVPLGVLEHHMYDGEEILRSLPTCGVWNSTCKGPLRLPSSCLTCVAGATATPTVHPASCAACAAGPFNQQATVLGGGNLPPRGPRLLSSQEHAHKGWRACKLEVLHCRASGVRVLS